jgi:TolA-binding protein
MRKINLFIIIVLTVLIWSCGEKRTASELWNSARTAQENENYKESISLYQQLVEKYPEDKMAPQAQFIVGDTYMNFLKDFNKAIQSYRDVVKKYPESEFAPKAQFMVGYIYANNLKDLISARAEYRQFKEKYPNHELITAVEFELENLGKDLSEIEALKNITKGE